MKRSFFALLIMCVAVPGMRRIGANTRGVAQGGAGSVGPGQAATIAAAQQRAGVEGNPLG